MNLEKLNSHADQLMAEIKRNEGKSPDVGWLDNYPPLLEAIEQVRSGAISIPYDLGLGRWMFESNIQDFPELTDRFVEFDLLLRGWALPSETGGVIK